MQFESNEHAARHAAEVPLQYVRPHSLAGSALAATVVHVPFADAPCPAAHAWQVPEQAVLQQKPSTQKPEVHWLAPLQAVPCTFFAVQVPALQ